MSERPGAMLQGIRSAHILHQLLLQPAKARRFLNIGKAGCQIQKADKQLRRKTAFRCEYERPVTQKESGHKDSNKSNPCDRKACRNHAGAAGSRAVYCGCLNRVIFRLPGIRIRTPVYLKIVLFICYVIPSVRNDRRCRGVFLCQDFSRKWKEAVVRATFLTLLEYGGKPADPDKRESFL